MSANRGLRRVRQPVRWVLALVLAMSAHATSAEALTRVIVQNNTTRAYSVHTTQSGYGLAGDKWHQSTNTVSPGQRIEVVWFNRDDGIKNGKDFFFSTSLNTADSSLLLKQKLHGSLINSHMWQSLEGPGFSHAWHDDRDTYHADWIFGDVSLHIKYRAFFTGTDDNIEYILAENYAVAPGGAETFNVLAYNIYMRPISLFANGQFIRASLLPGKLRGYDAIIFSEAFDDDVRNYILPGLRTEYPYATPVVGTDRGVEQDGGVIIVSKWPIEAHDQRRFQGTCAGSDCMSDKGVMYARINKEGKRYHVFGTHTQAWPTSEGAEVRRQQFDILKQFIDSKGIPAGEPVMIGGDLNVDKAKFPDQWQDMLTRLNAADPGPIGHPYSFDPATNRLAEQGAPSEYLDYVLYSKAHARPSRTYNEVRMIRSDEEWKEYFWEYAFWDLSDHFAQYGRFEFGGPLIGQLPPGVLRPMPSERTGPLFQSSAGPGNLELFIPLGDKIVHYWHARDDAPQQWRAGYVLNVNPTGFVGVKPFLGDALKGVQPKVLAPGVRPREVPDTPAEATEEVTTRGAGSPFTQAPQILQKPALTESMVKAIAQQPDPPRSSATVVALETTPAAGRFEVIARLRTREGATPRKSDYLASYTLNPTTKRWEGPQPLLVDGKRLEGVTGTPAFFQSTYGPGNFELFVPQGDKILHYWRERNDQPNQWRRGYVLNIGPVIVADLKPSLADALKKIDPKVLQPRVIPRGATERPNELPEVRPLTPDTQPPTPGEVTTRGTGSPFTITLQVLQNPALAQRLLDPESLMPEPPRNPVAVVALETKTTAGRFEVIARLRTREGATPRKSDHLASYTLNPTTKRWEGPQPLLVDGKRLEGVTGTPAFFQSTYGPGNFELFVPQGDKILHYWRERNDQPNQWRRGYVLHVNPPSFIGLKPSLAAALKQLEATVATPLVIPREVPDTAPGDEVTTRGTTSPFMQAPNILQTPKALQAPAVAESTIRPDALRQGVAIRPELVVAEPPRSPVSVAALESVVGSGRFEVVACLRTREGATPRKPNSLVAYSLDPNTKKWQGPRAILADGRPIQGMTCGDEEEPERPASGRFIQSTFGQQGNFELLIPQGPRLVHYWQDNDAAGQPWHRTPDLPLPTPTPGPSGLPTPLGTALLQSNLNNPGDLHAVVRMRPAGDMTGTADFLVHYLFDSPTKAWKLLGPVMADGQPVKGITGTPAFIRSTWGKQGNFELLAPQGPRLVHYWRDNDAAGQPWRSAPDLPLPEPAPGAPGPLVPVSTSLMQSNLNNPGDLHTVVRMRPAGDTTGTADALVHYVFDSPTKSWKLLGPVVADGQPIQGATGTPGFIQSTFGQQGNFELLIPQGPRLVHYWRDMDTFGQPWHRLPDLPLPPPAPGTFGPPAPASAALLQSNFNSPGNLYATVRMRPAGDITGTADFMVQYVFDSPTKTWKLLGPLVADGQPVAGVSGEDGVLPQAGGSGPPRSP